MSRYSIPEMRPHGGAIIHISSVHAFVSWAGSAAYDATKSGLLGMTRAMAIDHGPEGIRVNAICPGYIDTPLMEKWLDSVPDREATSARSLESASGWTHRNASGCRSCRVIPCVRRRIIYLRNLSGCGRGHDRSRALTSFARADMFQIDFLAMNPEGSATRGTSRVWSTPDLSMGFHQFGYLEHHYDGLAHTHAEYSIVMCTSGALEDSPRRSPGRHAGRRDSDC